MGSCSLQRSRARRSTFHGLYLPASFRPQGLVTLSAAYSLRAPAGHFSYRRRSWDSPCGAFSSRKVSAAFPRGRTHIPFLPSVIPFAEAKGPAQRAAVSGLRPFRESLATSTGLVRQPLDAPLGFALLGFASHAPHPGFRPGSSHALCDRRPRDQRRPVPRSFDRRSLGPIRADGRTVKADRATLSGFSHRCDPAHSSAPAPGL